MLLITKQSNLSTRTSNELPPNTGCESSEYSASWALRSLEVLTSLFSFKMDDDGDLPKTLVKLRRTPSDTPRPASTPPVIAASAIHDEDDEEKIIAELEVRRSID